MNSNIIRMGELTHGGYQHNEEWTEEPKTF